MRKIIFTLLLGILASPVLAHEPLQNASNLTRGTIPPARADLSSYTMVGNTRIPNFMLDPTSVTLLGPTGITATVEALLNSTYTKVMAYGGYVIYSTNTVCPFPGACFWTGASTINVIDVQASITFGSTVASTRFQIVESTGGTPNVPAQILPAITRFPPIEVTTSVASGVSSISIIHTTSVVIPANTLVGVQTTTAPTSGAMPQGFNIMLNVWKKPYGGL